MKFVRHILKGLGAAALFLALLSCAEIPEPPQTEQKEQPSQPSQPSQPGTINQPDNDDTTMPDKIQITISDKKLAIKIEDNPATRALVEALRKAPISFTASDYGGFEKVGALGRSLPTSNSQITTQPGDVILYSGNKIVLFYGSNTWSYTRIGKIEYTTLADLKSFLKAGEGDIAVTLTLYP